MSTPTNGPGPEGQPENFRPQDNHPQQGYYQEPPKKKRKIWPWVVGGIILVVVLLLGGCAALMGGAINAANNATQTSNDSAAQESDSPAIKGTATKDQLQIDTTATGSGSVTFGSGGSMSTDDFDSTWSKTVTAKDTDFFTVTVQDKSGAADAKVTCTLTEEGKKTEQQSATGAYAVATCTDTP
ncbi:hypothetical protein [Kocuria rhizophila]|uniref:hypothetical protein n=1 Tax=Kocuria rhizophila TaxID=72000 RepID=UPI0021A933E8|nr:hypothetical protein [Kocuria rhizophila]MCT2249416.1 hypothetical protein [Kocuria rhizophila]